MSSLQSTIELEILNIIMFLEPFLPLANSHMVDYILKPFYDRHLPVAIRNEIENIGNAKVLRLLFNNERLSNTPELIKYIENAKSLQLYNLHKVCLSQSQLDDKLIEWGCDLVGLKLDVFMSAKKSQEVEVLSKIAAAHSRIHKSTHTIDIGDGKGYLSSMLALHHKIPVLGIDCKLKNTEGAGRRVEMLSRVWNGVTRNHNTSRIQHESVSNEMSLYKQVTGLITEETDFRGLIRENFSVDSSRISLVGLHTCGNLGAMSVKIFNGNENIKTLCSVSCCYNLLTETVFSYIGFPVSTFLKNSGFKLGYNARMLSAQSIDRILYKKKLPNRALFYRSVLEVLLEEHGVLHLKRQVGKLRKFSHSFPEYARKALQNIDANINVSDQELNELFERYRECEDEFNVFHLLRCMLAPAIESLILLDRLLFLHENKHESAFLVQLFDPIVSPRCYGLIATKE